MSRRPLALTHDQTETIQSAANNIDPQWRQRFLSAVADNLQPCEIVTNADVAKAVGTVIRMMTLGSPSLTEDD